MPADREGERAGPFPAEVLVQRHSWLRLLQYIENRSKSMGMGEGRCGGKQAARNSTASDVGVDQQARDNSELRRRQARRRSSNQRGWIVDASVQGDVL